jgi:hypothetical protein
MKIIAIGAATSGTSSIPATGDRATANLKRSRVMSRTAFSVSVAAFLAAALAYQPASAQQQPAPICIKRAELLNQLENQFNESPVAMGVTDSGSLIEIYSSSDGATWTIGLTMPNGLTCLVATGQNWESVPRLAQLGRPA